MANSNNASEDMNPSNQDSEIMQVKKKRRIYFPYRCTYTNFYQREGKPDIQIHALLQVWQLHKRVLSKAAYFYSMFNMGWIESMQNVVRIEIEDTNITAESLDIIFNYCYTNLISVNSLNVIKILATASYFNMIDIIKLCEKKMQVDLKECNILNYYEFSKCYGCPKVLKTSIYWLQLNIMHLYEEGCLTILRGIDIDLMEKVIADTNLFVLNTEMNLYKLLKTWVYVRIVPDSEKPFESEDNFYSARTVVKSFLMQEEFECYVQVFKYLRTQHLTLISDDLSCVMVDNILPHTWIHNHMYYQWYNFVKRYDMEKYKLESIDEKHFNEHCIRVGCIFQKSSLKTISITDYNCGIDLDFSFNEYKRHITINRTKFTHTKCLIHARPTLDILIKAKIISINDDHQQMREQTTWLIFKTLYKSEKSLLIKWNRIIKPPFLLSVNLLVNPPIDVQIKNKSCYSADEEPALDMVYSNNVKFTNIDFMKLIMSKSCY